MAFNAWVKVHVSYYNCYFSDGSGGYYLSKKVCQVMKNTATPDSGQNNLKARTVVK